MEVGDIRVAKRAADAAFALNPRDAIANRHLAEIARRQESWALAAFHLEEYGRITGDAPAIRDAGLIKLFEMNKLAEAKELLRLSLAMDPDQEDLRALEEKIVKDGEIPEKPEFAARNQRDSRSPRSRSAPARSSVSVRQTASPLPGGQWGGGCGLHRLWCTEEPPDIEASAT